MLLAFLLATSVAIEVAEIDGVDDAVAIDVARALGRALTPRTGSPIVEGIDWVSCEGASDTLDSDAKSTAKESCLVAGLQSRTGARTIVLLRLFGRKSTIRVAARRFDESSPPAEATATLSGRAQWAEELAEVARSLFPAAAAPQDATQTPEVSEAEYSLAPWALLGAAALGITASAALFIAASSARERLETEALLGSQADELDSAMRGRSIAAQIALGTSVALAASGFVLLTF
ncbi:MAG: hypothetical protein HY791_09030 [Deltaproteobacteria bacterium]|nr:hypothetical protein [Deltaproteobacteria bacterium]